MSTSLPDRLELPGFLLRRPTADDAAAIADAVAGNLEHLAPWLPWATAKAGTEAAQRARLIDLEHAWAEGGDYVFLAVDGGGQVLGTFGVHRRIGPGAVEIGYWLTRDATGHGYATTATRALTTAALTLADVDRVEIHCDQANERSCRVPERLGYRLDRVEDRQVDAPAESGRSMVWVTP